MLHISAQQRINMVEQRRDLIKNVPGKLSRVTLIRYLALLSQALLCRSRVLEAWGPQFDKGQLEECGIVGLST